MRLLQILLLVFLPVAVAQAECERLSRNDTYEKLNKILDCLESKISGVQKKGTISQEHQELDFFKQPIGGEEVEDNDIVPDANLIRMGQRVRGKIPKPEDRDFYKFRTLRETEKFRVILRKLSRSGFSAVLTIYSESEEKLGDAEQYYDTPVSMLVEGKPDSYYYVSVKSSHNSQGEYELVVREEQ